MTAVGDDLFLNIELASIAARIGAPLSPNQAATVQYLDLLLASSPSPALAAFLNAITDLPTAAAIIAALDRLNPEHYLVAVGANLQSSQLFFDSLMSCPSAGGPGIVNRDGQCYWAQIRGRTTDWDQPQYRRRRGHRERRRRRAGVPCAGLAARRRDCLRAQHHRDRQPRYPPTGQFAYGMTREFYPSDVRSCAGAGGACHERKARQVSAVRLIQPYH